MIAFCACMRFSAWGKTIEFGASITSSVTSTPLSAGRQCIKKAFGPANCMRALSTCNYQNMQIVLKRWLKSEIQIQMIMCHNSDHLWNAPKFVILGCPSTISWKKFTHQDLLAQVNWYTDDMSKLTLTRILQYAFPYIRKMPKTKVVNYILLIVVENYKYQNEC